MDVPLTVQAVRISEAADYKLAELDLGIDFMDSSKEKALGKELTDRFADAPEGYRILPRVRLHASEDRQERHNHIGKRGNK